MRLLFLSTIFPDRGSPTRGTFNAALCRALSGMGHSVHVVAPRLPGEVFAGWRDGSRFTPPEEPNDMGISVDYPTAWLTPGCLHAQYGWQMDCSLRVMLQRVVREFRPDALLSYWAHPEGEVGAKVARRAGIPSVVIVGGSDVLVITRQQARRSKVIEALRNNSAVMTVSQSLRQRVIELGIPESRVQTIYQGIDETQFHQGRSREESRRRLGLSDDRAHLIWVGRMAEIKGLDLLLHAAGILQARDPNFLLHLLGDGPLRDTLRDQVEQLGLSNHVRFAGALPQAELPDWYRAADLTLLSSRSEGLPNVLRESLACGTPFVSTDVGSIREIAPPEASALVTPGDATAFADAVQRMLNPEARIAAQLYEARTWTNCAREVVSLFEELVRPGHEEGEGPADPGLQSGKLPAARQETGFHLNLKS